MIARKPLLNIWILQDPISNSTAFHRNAIVRPNKPGAKKICVKYFIYK